MAEAGWYPDPEDPNSLHYFDGQAWTGHRQPNPDAGQQGYQDAGQQGYQDAVDQGETVRRGDLPGFGAASSDQQYTDQQYADQQYGRQQHEQPTPDYGHHQVGPQYGAQTQQFDPAQAQGPSQQGQPPAGGWSPQGDPGQWQANQPTPNRPAKSKRGPLIAAAVVVVVVAGGLITWLAWPDDEPSLTYDGKEIASADTTLTKAEDAVDAAVKSRNGTKNDQTRCYFARPKKPASGAKSSDVEDALRCGPVLFVDGEKSSPYLKVSLNQTASGGKIELDPPDDVTSIQPSAVGDDVDLVRPDGETAPKGDGGLKVPDPPAAAKDSITSATLGSTTAPGSVTGAVMAGKYTKVTVTRAGEIKRYGTGDDARSAPDGQKLIAFQLTYGSGDVSGTSSDQTQARLLVDGGSPKELPSQSSSDTYIVAAVPSSGSAKLVLTEAGYTQSLSLPDGKPGSDNIAVLRRTTRSGYVGKTVSVPIGLRRGSQPGNAKFPTTATIASLDFWAAGATDRHASSVKNAILSVKLTYRFSGDTFVYPAKMLTLRLPGGKVARAKDFASGSTIYNVFEVPATFSRGTLVVSGTTKIGNINLRVKKARSFSISIPNR